MKSLATVSVLPKSNSCLQGADHETGDVKVIRGQGMPSYRHHDFGNLYLQFSVKFPQRLGGPDGEPMSEQDRAALERILGPRKQFGQPPADAMVEDFELEDIDPMRDQRAPGGATMEDDEDDMHGGPERVQCASQ